VRVKGVSFPDEVIQAARQGTLVVFAGAGVSFDAPSNFPSFEELTARVAKTTPLENDEQVSDRRLGILDDRGVAVQKIVRDILSDSKSEPNDNHYSLLGLFGSGRDIRVVTTNFDRHFTTAANGLFGDTFETHIAPHLPLGSDFDGVVYLHGSVDSPENQDLVLTDKDFGRAYVTEGWATRFLNDLFRQYTVLYIGYSHRDPVIHYLARGLRFSSSRFAIVKEAEAEQWKYRGITPIVFPIGADEDAYSCLRAAIRELPRRIPRATVDHEERVSDIVSNWPMKGPEMGDYLIECFKEVETAKFFVRYAQSLDWLHWAQEHNLFDPLLKSGPITEVSSLLARWFADRFACEHPDDAMSVVPGLKGTLHPEIWYEIANRLARDPRPATATFHKWISILLRSQGSAYVKSHLERVLERCTFPDDSDVATMLFERLTNPSPIFKKCVSLGGGPDIEMNPEVLGDEYMLRSCWERTLLPNLEHCFNEIAHILTTSIRQVNLLLRQWGKANDEWDAACYTRAAIEPHEQDKHKHSSIDFLIDCARDLVEWGIRNRHSEAMEIVEAWRKSPAPLLKRLAIHGVARDGCMTSDEQIEWLVTTELVYNRLAKHEVFQFVKRIYPGTSDTIRKRLVDSVSNWPQTGYTAQDCSYRDYTVCTIFEWIHRSASDCKILSEALRKSLAKCPDFRPHPEPDLHYRITTIQFNEAPLYTAEELPQQNLDEILKQLLTYQGDERTTRQSLLFQMQQTVASDFDWGWNLMEALKKREEWNTDIWPHVIHGWRNASIDEERFTQILGFLLNDNLLRAFHFEIAPLLLERSEQAMKNGSWGWLAAAEELASALWAAISAAPPVPIDTSDWSFKALNDSAGKVALFFVYGLWMRHREPGDQWQGVPEHYDSYLREITDGSSNAASLGRVMLAGDLEFLFEIDPAWARKHMFPLFDWSISSINAEQCWQGLCCESRRVPPRCYGELLPLYENTFSHLDALGPRRDTFREHIARIYLYSERDDLDADWLAKSLSKTVQEDRESWSWHVSHLLCSMSVEERRRAWESKLKPYWELRNYGKPYPLSDLEKAEMIRWIMCFRDVFPEAVDMVCHTLAPKRDHFIYYELARSGLANEFPQPVTRLLKHLLSGVGTPFHSFVEVDNLLDILVKHEELKPDLRVILDYLAALGYPDAIQRRKALDAEIEPSE
jgi:hypothetical protein